MKACILSNCRLRESGDKSPHSRLIAHDSLAAFLAAFFLAAFFFVVFLAAFLAAAFFLAPRFFFGGDFHARSASRSRAFSKVSSSGFMSRGSEAFVEPSVT